MKVQSWAKSWEIENTPRILAVYHCIFVTPTALSGNQPITELLLLFLQHRDLNVTIF